MTEDAGWAGHSRDGWNYFAKDAAYSDVLKARLADGVEMDSAKALGAVLQRHARGDLTVVDFGSGPGHYFPVLARSYQGGALRYLGVDIDESNIRFGSAHFRGEPRVEMRVGSVLEPAALRGGMADEVTCAVSANTLPHVPSVVPLLSWLRETPRVRCFVFRMLIGSECVQIKKHLQERTFDGMFERDFQFNNIYSLAFLRHHLGPRWQVTDEPDSFDAARLAQHSVPAGEQDAFYKNRVSRSVGDMVFKGDIYMPWRFAVGTRVEGAR